MKVHVDKRNKEEVRDGGHVVEARVERDDEVAGQDRPLRTRTVPPGANSKAETTKKRLIIAAL